MSPEKQKLLNDRFPHLFKTNRNHNHSMALFGVECADGWYDLLFDLLIKIETYLKTQPPEAADSFSVQQIKEKFGTLRFYANCDNEVEKLISAAEDVSAKTCELCGKPGKMRDGGWLAVKCHQHHLESIARLIIPQVQAYSEPYTYVSPYKDELGKTEVRIRTKENAAADMMYRVTKDLGRFLKDDEDVSEKSETEG